MSNLTAIILHCNNTPVNFAWELSGTRQFLIALSPIQDHRIRWPDPTPMASRCVKMRPPGRPVIRRMARNLPPG
ncbi:hypothetical protein BRAS3809_3760004 [Bradyrhizobium sp. STM 3809]|nr:hypothetical protein BRAS3809_3760004 [Bradyrhizobium sp. STM 3809]